MTDDRAAGLVELKNHERYIRKLDAAVEAHTLDEAGVLEELGRAAAACFAGGRTATQEANALYLARCAYVAEAHRRTVGRRTRGLYKGELSGFRAWCSANGMSWSTGHRCVQIASAPNPLAMLKRLQGRARRTPTSVGNGPQDALTASKRWWGRMGPDQRNEFMGWILEHPEGEEVVRPPRRAPRPGARARSRAAVEREIRSGGAPWPAPPRIQVPTANDVARDLLRERGTASRRDVADRLVERGFSASSAGSVMRNLRVLGVAVPVGPGTYRHAEAP